jgi:uncharacterized protein (DUF1501 family)
LFFVQLNGGNDGLNTFIPFEDALYDLRPKNCTTKESTMQLKEWRFTFLLEGFCATKWRSIGYSKCGYPNPARSHFRSQEIWQPFPLINIWLGCYWICNAKKNTNQ